MDQSHRAKKLKPMKKHKKNRLIPPNNHLILNLLTGLMCILACSNHFFLPSSSIESYLDHFLSVTLPRLESTFLHPKCLFLVVNAIVMFLIGESRLRALPSSPADDLYTEYVRQVSQGKKDFKVYDPVPRKKNNKERDSKKNFIGENQEVEEVREERTRTLLEKGKEEEEEELPAEELNRRVEAFIARVNKRRRLEARTLTCADA
ncbi:uncharacterized protein LOC115738951 [Rhodamnia argentea]|uniref:Uncharacterized protein LOC115738951 n=1 Tax=Rhodamnia argentea TaxID=178133 RepID=A0A8B8NYJ6_9MYRT|nr:uncharacterized protein LOC115738951 [Rhodamnia argentea]